MTITTTRTVAPVNNTWTDVTATLGLTGKDGNLINRDFAANVYVVKGGSTAPTGDVGEVVPPLQSTYCEAVDYLWVRSLNSASVMFETFA